MRVGVIEMRKNRLLVRHRDAETVERNLAHAAHQILERLGVERKINAVHVLTAQRRVHDDGRERMLDGIAGDSIDASGSVDLIDAVDASQFPCTDLTGCGFKIGADRAKGENAPGAHAEHTADDPLLSHAQPDQRMLVALRLQKLHHAHVVGERGSGADDFVKICRDLQHFRQRLIEVARRAEIMERQNKSSAAAQARNRLGFRFQGALKFQVDHLTARRIGLGEHFQLGSQRSLELAVVVGTTAGTDGGDVLMGFKKTMDFGKRGQGLLQVVQSKFKEGVIPSHGLGGGEHVVDGVAAQRQADLRQAHGQKTGRESGRSCQGHLFSMTARYYRGVGPDATLRLPRASVSTLGAIGLNTLVTLTPGQALVTFRL